MAPVIRDHRIAEAAWSPEIRGSARRRNGIRPPLVAPIVQRNLLARQQAVATAAAGA
ncbi:hypothetical protein [Rubellimicrobium aerolatum]|uniref:Uncharacterized protein n=1 Tax=Rubellimicrobium aerolatum TaxID=490979 RepID=A0ABW0S8T9_9RHOB|nr:hypothetical protein [Rubellimicrobium aerolatum]MBP1804644.1 hypothetical protein [Rubellimicrobium aerolatum]